MTGKTVLDYVPFYRDSTRAWGAVNRILAIPCATPTAVYIEAAVHGLWKIGYNILSPDPKEIYHQLIGNSLYHDIKQAAQDTKIVSPVGESRITRGLFFLADFVDVAAWYMFVFGSVVDGLVDFSTQIQRNSGCNPKNSPKFFQGGPWINAIGDDGAWYGDLFAGVNGQGQPLVHQATFTTVPGVAGFAGATTKFSTFGGVGEVPFDTAVILTATGQLMDLASVDPKVPEGQSFAHVFFKTKNNKPETFTYEVRSRYTGQESLPLHEAFRDGENWFGYCFDPSLS